MTTPDANIAEAIVDAAAIVNLNGRADGNEFDFDAADVGAIAVEAAVAAWNVRRGRPKRWRRLISQIHEAASTEGVDWGKPMTYAVVMGAGCDRELAHRHDDPRFVREIHLNTETGTIGMKARNPETGGDEYHQTTTKRSQREAKALRDDPTRRGRGRTKLRMVDGYKPQAGGMLKQLRDAVSQKESLRDRCAMRAICLDAEGLKSLTHEATNPIEPMPGVQGEDAVRILIPANGVILEPITDDLANEKARRVLDTLAKLENVEWNVLDHLPSGVGGVLPDRERLLRMHGDLPVDEENLTVNETLAMWVTEDLGVDNDYTRMLTANAKEHQRVLVNQGGGQWEDLVTGETRRIKGPKFERVPMVLARSARMNDNEPWHWANIPFGLTESEEKWREYFEEHDVNEGSYRQWMRQGKTRWHWLAFITQEPAKGTTKRMTQLAGTPADTDPGVLGEPEKSMTDRLIEALDA